MSTTRATATRIIVDTAASVGSVSFATALYNRTGKVVNRGLLMNSAVISSSHECTNAKSAPAITPGAIAGSATLRNALSGGAPRLAAALNCCLSKVANAAATGMTTNGSG